MRHQPVLLQEIIDVLDPQPDDTVLDATVNRAGHARALAEKLGPGGLLIGLDADPAATFAAQQTLNGLICHVEILTGNFRDLKSLLAKRAIGTLDIALFDLGLSSEQLADPQRGFSFQTSGPLNMTFAGQGPKEKNVLTAAEIVNNWEKENLEAILKGYGEEIFAHRIAEAIAGARRIKPITATDQLVEIVRSAVPLWYRRRRLHFATKTFQALRMAVNDEINALKEGLSAAWSILNPDGRLAVITFHGGEARIVKNFFREKIEVGEGKTPHKKALKPQRKEILKNPRARSALLRILVKIKTNEDK